MFVVFINCRFDLYKKSMVDGYLYKSFDNGNIRDYSEMKLYQDIDLFLKD